MSTLTLSRLKKIFQMPPHVVGRRIVVEINRAIDRLPIASRHSVVTPQKLLRETGDASIDHLWHRLGTLPYFATIPRDRELYARTCPDDEQRILGEAERAIAHYVDLLGSGEIHLGENIDWQRDYLSDYSWPKTPSSGLDYFQRERPCDVKFPWEVSRMHWMISVGQAYCLTGDEYYAAFARDTLENWFEENPFNIGVNYACTMEVAMRMIVWTWFFHVFRESRLWASTRFREQFLCNVFSHGYFVERYLEYSDINGNHCTADAGGMMFAGLFFGKGATARRWQAHGWRLLCDEIPKQVYSDGVDFEGSTAYHRLVLELFLFPAMYAKARGIEVRRQYTSRLAAMAEFSSAITRPDGTVPVFGDADDGRVLPMGPQGINDHRYLSALVGALNEDLDLGSDDSGSKSETFWLFGNAKQSNLPARKTSQAFRHGGNFVMRNARDFVFIDCGPVGQNGRGGHGHNDCLSFDAMLDGVPLITDCGCNTYTGSYDDRNLFRSTQSHNTPQVDGEEINRFVHPHNLWALRDDAQPNLVRWETSEAADVFQGSHSGYDRLAESVTPTRTIRLDHLRHSLEILDEFKGTGDHHLRIPLHLAVGVELAHRDDGSIRLKQNDKEFLLVWDEANDWELSIEPIRVAPSYGCVQPSKRLVWQREGALRPLRISIEPT